MANVSLVRDSMPSILPMQGRSKGDHVSVLTDEICVRLGHYKRTIGKANQARLELGNAWEYGLISRLHQDDPERYFQPGEIMLDRNVDGSPSVKVFGTPDLLDANEQADHEIKCTWMSSKNGPGSEKFFKYEMQLKAYLHMLGWSLGYMHVCFINGDYSYLRRGSRFEDEGGPQYRVWRYQFGVKELEMNWRTLLKQAAKPRQVRKVEKVAA